MTKIWGFLLDPSFSQLLTSFLTLSSAFVGEPSAKELDKKLVKKRSEKEGFPDKEGWPDTHNLQRASSVSAYKEATKILTDKVWGYLIAKISF